MAFPFLGDVFNHFFGLDWNLPIPMFGLFVATAIVLATYVARKEVERYQGLSLLGSARVIVSKTGETQWIPVHGVISDLALVCAIAGIVGARVFHILEYPSDFLGDPMSMIFTQGGFSIYGGLVFGFVAGIVFLRKREIPLWPMLDALSPSLILGYAIGRVGCQISGDGDWGIAADLGSKPDWLPQWFWAQTYENNVIGVVIQSPGVYPTPLYEVLMGLLIFAILWNVRKRFMPLGMMFFLYLLLSGFERLLIEQIRINTEYRLFNLAFTQAELISTLLIIIATVGIVRVARMHRLNSALFVSFVSILMTACMSL
ncbi:MAG: prolipoprotein diacylglyceryl transferase [Gammaproteobacteria bacterium]|nr:prolipoprotein diacylglyceryl transferase [Gammaproteobacteria bacterium]